MAHPRPTVIGSCGISGLRPSNTLASFEHALDHGIDGIEFDYQVTADGHVVGHHDYRINADLARDEQGEWLPEAGPPIRSLTLDQVRVYDMGRAKPGSRATRSYPDQVAVDGERIPTLEELLAALARRNDTTTELWIEVKTDPSEAPDITTPPDEFLAALLPRLEAADGIARTVLIAFDWRVLRLAMEAQPSIRTGFLTADTRHIAPDRDWPSVDGHSTWWGGWDPIDHGGTFISAVRAAGGTYWSPLLKDLTPELVAEAHEAGIQVSTWGVGSDEEMALALDLGIDSITASRPDLLKQRVASRFD
ncbi:MAG: glycerophosphodiester phosphodiesterase [Dehalococcoidia bacterium]|jgi:glycerophosphoryl diester phosphodiesterase|nr:glycerophosphodiester phosphodiesterase [Dehalococcoidia bacterium]